MSDVLVTRVGTLVAAIACIAVLIACAPNESEPMTSRADSAGISGFADPPTTGPAQCWGYAADKPDASGALVPFEIPCPALVTTEFVETLQRALAVRGHFHGPVSGALDPPTRSAIRAYQVLHGHDSAVLSLHSARRLGLVAYYPAER